MLGPGRRVSPVRLQTALIEATAVQGSFLPSQVDRVFADWRESGLVALKADKHFDSFGQLTTKFNLPNSHHFQYLQIRHCVKGVFPNFDTMPTICPFYDLMLLLPDSRHLISHFVSFSPPLHPLIISEKPGLTS